MKEPYLAIFFILITISYSNSNEWNPIISETVSIKITNERVVHTFLTPNITDTPSFAIFQTSTPNVEFMAYDENAEDIITTYQKIVLNFPRCCDMVGEINLTIIINGPILINISYSFYEVKTIYIEGNPNSTILDNNLSYVAYRLNVSALTVDNKFPSFLYVQGIPYLYYFAAPVRIRKDKFPISDYQCISCITDINYHKVMTIGVPIPLMNKNYLGDYYIAVGNKEESLFDIPNPPFVDNLKIHVSTVKQIHILDKQQFSLTYYEPQYYFMDIKSDLNGKNVSFPFYIRFQVDRVGVIILIGKGFMPTNDNHTNSVIFGDVNIIECDPFFSPITPINEFLLINSKSDIEMYYILVQSYIGVDIYPNKNNFTITTSIEYPEKVELGSCIPIEVGFYDGKIFEITATEPNDEVSILISSLSTIEFSYVFGFMYNTIPSTATSSNENYIISQTGRYFIFLKNSYSFSYFCQVKPTVLKPFFALYVSSNSSAVCSGHSTCYIDYNNKTTICYCDYQVGDKCQYPCPLYNNQVCNGGTCFLGQSDNVDTALCGCNENYFGSACQFFCDKKMNCSDHGNCILIGETIQCTCEDGWNGKKCEQNIPQPQSSSQFSFEPMSSWIYSYNSIIFVAACGLFLIIIIIIIGIIAHITRKKKSLYETTSVLGDNY